MTKTTRRIGLGVLAVLLLTISVGSPARSAHAVTPVTGPIAQLRSLPAGTVVTAVGVVTDVPGNIGSNFYIQDTGVAASSTTPAVPAGGIQVYYGSNTSIVPTLVEGDTVQVTGAIATFGAGGYGNQREISSVTSVTKTNSTAGTPVTPATIHTVDAKYHAGQLVRMSAKVVGARNYAGQVLITDSSNKNQGLVVIYLNGGTGIAYAPIHGDAVCVTGIVEPYGYGNFPQRRLIEIQPRRQSDISLAACA